MRCQYLTGTLASADGQVQSIRNSISGQAQIEGTVWLRLGRHTVHAVYDLDHGTHLRSVVV